MSGSVSESVLATVCARTSGNVGTVFWRMEIRTEVFHEDSDILQRVWQQRVEFSFGYNRIRALQTFRC